MWPFSETVLLWRLHRGLTQAELATASGVSRPNLSAIERGEREVTLSTLRALACALGTSPGALADGRSPYGEPLSLSRNDLEKVAQAAATGKDASTYDLLVRCLRAVTVSRRAIIKGGKTQPESRLATEHAYLILKAMITSGTINSLIARIDGCLERDEAETS